SARTFSLHNLGRHKESGFDLCDDVHCQVYGGLDAEALKSNKAVDMTAGEVLVYKNKLAEVFYHSTCGGYTANVLNVWNGSRRIDYLSGRRCGFCKNSSHYNWDIFLSFKELEKMFTKKGYSVKPIQKAKISSFTRSGRVKKIVFMYKGGTLSLKGTEFRALAGYFKLKSTMFKIYNKKDGIKIIGHGFGHGVGLCQTGAKTMAGKRYSYKSILEYYYPGTEIKSWDKISD
ncbi:SpoIID/LytB domain-containing protein, partial [bacterium]